MSAGALAGAGLRFALQRGLPLLLVVVLTFLASPLPAKASGRGGLSGGGLGDLEGERGRPIGGSNVTWVFLAGVTWSELQSWGRPVKRVRRLLDWG